MVRGERRRCTCATAVGLLSALSSPPTRLNDSTYPHPDPTPPHPIPSSSLDCPCVDPVNNVSYPNCSALTLDNPLAAPLRCPNASEVERFRGAVAKGDIYWHAAPMNMQVENMSPTLFDAGLEMMRDFDREFYGKNGTFTMSDRDVIYVTRATSGYWLVHIGLGGGSLDSHRLSIPSAAHAQSRCSPLGASPDSRSGAMAQTTLPRSPSFTCGKTRPRAPRSSSCTTRTAMEDTEKARAPAPESVATVPRLPMASRSAPSSGRTTRALPARLTRSWPVWTPSGLNIPRPRSLPLRGCRVYIYI